MDSPLFAWGKNLFLGAEWIQSAEPDNKLGHSGAVHLHGPGPGILRDQVFFHVLQILCF